jgi:hypothetical protein
VVKVDNPIQTKARLLEQPTQVAAAVVLELGLPVGQAL